MPVALAAGAAPAAPGAPAPQLVLALPGVPPAFLGVRAYVAAERGFYRRSLGRRATLRIADYDSGLDALRAVESGQADLAWVPTASVVAAVARGAPLVAIEGIDRSDWEIGSTDPAVATCADLRGQTVGVDAAGGAGYDALVAMLAACGLRPGDVHVEVFPGDTGMNAQIAGQLAVAVEQFDQVAQVEAMGRPVTVVERLAAADPGQHYALLVTTRPALARERALLVAVLEADAAATRWLAAPAHLAAAAAIAEITGETGPVAAAAIRHYLAIGWWNSSTAGLDPARLARTIALGLQLGLLPPSARTLTPEAFTDPTLWQAAVSFGRRA